MNLWEFLARVFSLTGGGKKFRTGAGGLGLQSIVMELLIKFSCGDYENTVVCDVLPMGACQLLLG